MKRKSLSDIIASIILASVLGALAFIYIAALIGSSAPVIAAFIVANLRSFVRRKVRFRWILILLGLPTVVVAGALLAIRLPVWTAPLPIWKLNGATLSNRGKLTSCNEWVPAVYGEAVQLIKSAENNAISQNQAYQIATLMILQVDWSKDTSDTAIAGFTWYPLLFQSSLVTTKFPDGKQKSAWYVPIATKIGHHFSGAVLALAYIDAQTGTPLMLITGLSVQVPSADSRKPNGCPPFAPNRNLQQIFQREIGISLLFALYLWVVMLVCWITWKPVGVE